MKINHVEVRYGEKRRKGALHVGYGGTAVSVETALAVCVDAARKTFGDKDLGQTAQVVGTKGLGSTAGD